MRQGAWLSLLFAVSVAVACGGKTDAPGGGGSGGTTGGSGGTTGGSGGTSGGTGGTSATGGMGGTGGVSPACQTLDNNFKAALAQAKYCNSLINSLQCTLSVGDDIQCPCPTYVNPVNSDAITQMNKLQAEWQAQGCNLGIACAGMACPVPQGSGCVPNGGGGDADACQDFWPD